MKKHLLFFFILVFLIGVYNFADAQQQITDGLSHIPKKQLDVQAYDKKTFDYSKAAATQKSTFQLGNRLFSVPTAYIPRRGDDYADFRDVMRDRCFRLVNGTCKRHHFKLSIKYLSPTEMEHEIKKWKDDFENSCKTVEQVISESHMPNHPMSQSGDYCRYVFPYTPHLLARIDMKTGAFPKDTIEQQVIVARKFLDTYSQPTKSSKE